MSVCGVINSDEKELDLIESLDLKKEKERSNEEGVNSESRPAQEVLAASPPARRKRVRTKQYSPHPSTYTAHATSPQEVLTRLSLR